MTHPQALIFLFRLLQQAPQPLNFLRNKGQLLLILFIHIVDLLVLLLKYDQRILHIDEFYLVVALGDG